MMDQHVENGPISPAILHLWEQRAKASGGSADIWRDYAMMMAAFQSALDRAPRTAEGCENVDIESLLVSEIEHLANLASALFPAGGIMEFAYYVTGTQPDRPTSKNSRERIGVE